MFEQVDGGARERLKRACISFGLCAFLLLSTATVCKATNETEARFAIDQAQQDIISGYESVALAEKAGANASSLLTVLDDAGKLLSEADLSFVMKNFSSARDLAVASSEKLTSVRVQADALRKTAAQQSYMDFMINIVGSLVGTVVVLIGCSLVWFFLKRRGKMDMGAVG